MPANKHTSRLRRRSRFYFLLPCFTLFTLFLAALSGTKRTSTSAYGFSGTGRRILQEDEENATDDCIPPSIDSFPPDFFSQEQRQNGGVVVHAIILLYLCAMLSIVCDDYFVPSLEIISSKMKLSSDVAGATFMAIGTSSPELFSSIIGSFITQGDIGIGTIVGSAVFNILGVTGMAGIVIWNKDVQLDWYPVIRDGSVYLVTVAALTIIISNNMVSWWESLIMIVMFAMYIILMYFNPGVQKFSQKMMKQMKWNLQRGSCCCACGADSGERTPLLGRLEPEHYTPEVIEKSAKYEKSCDSYSVEIPANAGKIGPHEQSLGRVAEESVLSGSLCSPPEGSCWQVLWWAIMWPTSLLFFVTIPDCRKESLEKFYIITFFSAIVWLGGLTYLCVWMVTVIGYTFSIPDTVSGLTLLAVGTSLPEILSSLIVVRNGLGNMVMSNLIGSNIFDILFCLGVPWFIKALSSPEGYVIINSSGLTYTTTTLLTTVVALLLVFHFSSWKLNRMMGLTCLLIYAIFISLACLYELNVFGVFNPPACH